MVVVRINEIRSRETDLEKPLLKDSVHHNGPTVSSIINFPFRPSKVPRQIIGFLPKSKFGLRYVQLSPQP